MIDRLNTTYPIYFPQSTINFGKVDVEEVRRLVEKLPEESAWDDLMYEIVFDKR